MAWKGCARPTVGGTSTQRWNSLPPMQAGQFNQGGCSGRGLLLGVGVNLVTHAAGFDAAAGHGTAANHEHCEGSEQKEAWVTFAVETSAGACSAHLT